MMNLNVRTSAPSVDNKYYLRPNVGGVNECMEIKNGSCLPNCVGYCWGRAYEILGYKPKLCTYDAENWYTYTGDGYERSSTPKPFSIICWRKGEANNPNDGYGHVAFVEIVKPNGDIIISESDYYGVRWKTKTITKNSGYYYNNGYTLQGFIILPVTYNKEYTVGDYKVTCDVLNVRKGAGTNYDRILYDNLTENAKKQIAKLADYNVNGYPYGVECTVFEVVDNWGRTPSGWICLDYCEKI